MSSSATPPEPSADDYSTVELSRLRVGTPLFAPVFDVRDVLLLAEGQPVTDAFLERLRDREIRSVRAHGRDVTRAEEAAAARLREPQGTATEAPPDRTGYVSPYRNETSDRLDAEIGMGRLQPAPSGDPLSSRGARNDGRPYDPATLNRLVAAYNRSTLKMCGVYERIANGDGLDRTGLDQIADQALTDLVEDVDLFAGVSCNPSVGEYPVRHSVNTAMLALAVGVRLELDLPALRELVVGCLVHDAGMLGIDRSVYDNAETLDPVRFLEITKHPVLVFDVLKDPGVIPKRSAFVAYQMHERCDGSGYPRRRTARQIHVLSRIAAVADAYVALVSPRRHRPALMPYRAMEKILHDVKRGLYDGGVVRGLLRTLSLFPIGSYVELSDGSRGRVLRAGVNYWAPTIELDAGTAAAKTIDLAATPGLSVVRALPTLDATDAASVARAG